MDSSPRPWLVRLTGRLQGSVETAAQVRPHFNSFFISSPFISSRRIDRSPVYFATTSCVVNFTPDIMIRRWIRVFSRAAASPFQLRLWNVF